MQRENNNKERDYASMWYSHDLGSCHTSESTCYNKFPFSILFQNRCLLQRFSKHVNVGNFLIYNKVVGRKVRNFLHTL